MKQNIQALRAAACLLVIAFHAQGGTWPNGAAGVDLFFVISGLVMGLTSTGLTWQVFARRRLCRLVPLYWGLTSAKLLIGQVMPSTLAATHPGAWNMAASFLFIPSRDGAGLVRPVLGVGWTLQFEMLFYVLFALSLALRRPPLRVLLPMLLPLAVLGFMRRPDWPAPLSLANGLVLEFCAGLILAKLTPRLSAMPRQVGWLLVAAGLVLLLGLPEPGPWRFLMWGGPACAIVAGALGLERSLGRRVPRAVLAVGEASYAIYLLHPFLTPTLARAAAGLGAGPIGSSLRVCASLLLCTLAGVALDRWADRPVQDWLRGTKQAFFFEKKKQKNFCPCCRRLAREEFGPQKGTAGFYLKT